MENVQHLQSQSGGMWTNDTSPVQKAQELREAIAQKGM